MQTVEVTGKSVEEATALAAQKLGVDAKSIVVTVLDESKKLFGKSQVRIRADKTENATESAGSVGNDKVPKATAKTTKTAVKPESEPAKAPARKRPTAAENESSEGGETEQNAKPKRTTRKKSETEASQATNGQADSDDSSEPDETKATEITATAEDGKAFVQLVRDLTEKASLQVQAEVTNLNGKYVTIELDGKDVAYLIGRHGEVLNAMQSLVNIIASKKFGNGVRATLDGANYREKREADLQEMATKIAEEAKSRKEEAVLDALPAFERRIVHKILSEMEGITTYSEGEEPNRHVVIAPKD